MVFYYNFIKFIKNVIERVIKMKNHKTILIITDGIGYKPDSLYNAFRDAETPTYDRLFQTVPHTLISTHGLSVGLPEGQMGNSEVGHMTIGSGRILYQDLVKISLALEDGSLEKNEALNQTLAQSDRVHLIGLLSDGGVHSHIAHTIGLAKLAAARGKRVFLHLITDGRDVSPTSAPEYLSQIEAICEDLYCDDRRTFLYDGQGQPLGACGAGISCNRRGEAQDHTVSRGLYRQEL